MSSAYLPYGDSLRECSYLPLGKDVSIPLGKILKSIFPTRTRIRAHARAHWGRQLKEPSLMGMRESPSPIRRIGGRDSRCPHSNRRQQLPSVRTHTRGGAR